MTVSRTGLWNVVEAFRREADRLGLQDEQDVVEMIREIRGEKR
ncbi:MAG: hypothetical protein ACI39W_10680 [Brotaphodocola sp.]